MSFKELTIVVGKNNAGKSTLIEALRILSLVVNRAKNSLFVKAPNWLDINEDVLGIKPSLLNLDISTQNIFYLYGNPPAKIFAEFENGTKINVFIGEDTEIFATFQSSDGKSIESKKFASTVKMDDIKILPQISPLLKKEPVIKFETVQRNLLTNLSSRNFRNQINYFPKDFAKFKELAERTWQGLGIDSTSDNIRRHGDLFLFVRDNRFEAEIGWMGHGLQMWLQTIWFLSRCSNYATVILDEPDVYMHADLQRRLIKLIKRDFKQVIVATHSVEIMAEVEPENILPIDSSKSKQSYANNAPLVQKIVNDIGSVHNIEIARIFSHNKFLIVEGERDDVKILTIFQSKLFPNSFEQFDILPKIFVEGWGGWQRVIGSHKVFKDNSSTIKTYCIFDSDYHTNEGKIERKIESEAQGINLHIWGKKEIENYLICPAAIFRLIKKNKSAALTEGLLIEKIDSIANELKDDIIDSFATEVKNKDNSKSVKTANQEARLYINSKWELEKLSLVPGKTMISAVSKWASEEFKISINKFAIAREMTESEIDNELKLVIQKIEGRQDFD
jgi:predicted ATP-dependent endonuclease of OLD family